jgi:DNA-binding winged helix-turn-helix (wHTH) protein
VTYAFGGICVNARARSVSNAAGPIHLTRKAFELLLLLLENQPHAVSKEDMHARLWPDTFVADSSLQALIHEIRQALDVPGSLPSWIRTVHGVGYAFAGEVRVRDTTRPPMRPGRPAAWLVGDTIRVALHAGENVVGRGLDDGIEIDAPTISRRHACVRIADTVTIEDLTSKNGTWIDDERVTTRRTLADGDIVRFGSARFTFRLARPSSSTESIVGD